MQAPEARTPSSISIYSVLLSTDLRLPPISPHTVIQVGGALADCNDPQSQRSILARKSHELLRTDGLSCFLKVSTEVKYAERPGNAEPTPGPPVYSFSKEMKCRRIHLCEVKQENNEE